MDQIRVSGLSRLESLDLKKRFPDAAIEFEAAAAGGASHGELVSTTVLVGLTIVGIQVLAAWLLKTRKSNRIEKTIEIVKSDGTRRTEHVVIEGDESKSEAAVIKALGKLTSIDVSSLVS